MKRALPLYTIEGTAFIVDVDQLLLQEKDNPENRMHIRAMREAEDGYHFLYCLETKGIPPPGEHATVLIKIPELVKLDPVGMAEKYGFAPEEIKNKTDFDVMVNAEALNRRLQGTLPTLDILGDLYCVDIQMKRLRPMSDLTATGIELDEIHAYLNEDGFYFLPYNRKEHCFEEPDYETLTDIPKDLEIVSFPLETRMDPIGYNRSAGFHELRDLKFEQLQSHFKAVLSSWEKLGIREIIETNLQNNRRQVKQYNESWNSTRLRKGIRF